MARAAAPANETPEARFIRLANIRVVGALEYIANLGALVGPNYKSTAEQHAKLCRALREEVDKTEKLLTANKTAEKVGRAVL